MNIEDLTIKEARGLSNLFNSNYTTTGLNNNVGKNVIIRTYSAGVWFGLLKEKAGKEVILDNARRLWYWKTANGGISLSEVANSGLHKDSKVCEEVNDFWTEAIEIIPCTDAAIKNIGAKDDYKT